MALEKTKGTDVYLMVDVGSEAWRKVGGQKDATFDRGVGTMDITNKGSEGDEEHLIGNRNWSFSFDALLIEDDEGWLAIEAAFDAGDQLPYKFVTPGFDYKGSATVESLSIAAPDAEASVVSLTLKGTGALSKTSN